MIIGFDAKRLFNNFTGLGNYSRTLLHNLLYFSQKDSYYLYSPSILQRRETEEFIKNPQYRIIVPDTIFKSYWRSVLILKQLLKDNVEIFHGLSHEIPLNIQKSKIRSVVTMHDLIFEIYPETYSFIDRNIYSKKYRYSCKISDKIIAISESTKNDIVKLYGIGAEKIEVIYQSCHPLFYNLADNINSDEILRKYNIPSNYLLYVGSVIERKNLATIINSFGHLSNDFMIPLVVVGNGGKYKSLIKRLIRSRGLEKYVIWIENLTTGDDLRVLYRRAATFIYPSMYEGFGIPIVEALLSKTPVITSNVSSLPEAGGPGSYYIDPTDSEQLASGIEKILSDANYKENMIKIGHSYAMDKFDAERTTKQLLAVYENLESATDLTRN